MTNRPKPNFKKQDEPKPRAAKTVKKRAAKQKTVAAEAVESVASPLPAKGAPPHPSAKTPPSPEPAPSRPKPQLIRTTQASPAKEQTPAQPTTTQSPAAASPATTFTAQTTAPSPSNVVAGAAETLEQSFRAASRGSVALNCKILDIARENFAASFDLVKSLAAARTPLEAAQLQFAFINEQIRAFASQSEELRALSAACLTEASEHLGRKPDRTPQ